MDIEQKPAVLEFLESPEMEDAIRLIDTAVKQDVAIAIEKSRRHQRLELHDIAALVSKCAADSLEELAQESSRLSLNHFGKSVVLYTPIYLSNYCINTCRYCNYGADHKIKRRSLNLMETQQEAQVVSETGLRHVLLLTGESDYHYNFERILEAVDQVSSYFDAVSLESYALSSAEYARLESRGVVGVTLYQETYDQERYSFLHPCGPKSDYLWRLGVPERVGKSGMRQLNLGVLMGLSDWRRDVLKLAAHGRFIQQRHPGLELSFSLPRMIAFDGADFEGLGIEAIQDRDYVQAICALRLALPQFGINVSTRETAMMRRCLLPIGVNKMSAGVSTEVGGHLDTADRGEGQFKIADDSSVDAVRTMIIEAGYQPVLRDWIKF